MMSTQVEVRSVPVNGSVSFRWISLWEMAQLYLPGYWIPGIFAILAFCSYLFDRRRFGVA